MIGVVAYNEVKGRGFRPKGGKERQGSRRWVELADGSIVKWWKGEWRFSAVRWNSKPTTSFNLRAMSVAEENGRATKVEERYTDFDKFSKRMVAIIGIYDFLRMIEWIKG